LTPQEIANAVKEACLNAAVMAEKFEGYEGEQKKTLGSEVAGLLTMLGSAVTGWKNEIVGTEEEVGCHWCSDPVYVPLDECVYCGFKGHIDCVFKHECPSEKGFAGGPKFKIFQYADVATAYLKESDWELMSDANVPGHLAKLDGGVGDFYHVCVDDQNMFYGFYVPKWEKAGLSNQFIEIMKYLYEQKIPYVRFDADGSDVKGMEYAS
jgi:hypothetical protein